MAAYLREHGACPKGIPDMAATALDAVQAQTVQLLGETTTAVLLARLAQQLLVIDGQIKDTDKLITAQFRAHPQAEVIESLPGLGPILGAEFAEFIAITGGSLTSFATAGRLASHAGLIPIVQNSGRVTENLRRLQRDNHRPERVFYMATQSSIRPNRPSRAFHDRKRDERLTHTQIPLALARHQANVLWALLRERRTFTSTAPQPTTAPA